MKRHAGRSRPFADRLAAQLGALNLYNLKTTSSRLLRKEFVDQHKRVWAPSAILKQYRENGTIQRKGGALHGQLNGKACWLEHGAPQSQAGCG
jgi:hypothetical protein